MQVNNSRMSDHGKVTTCWYTRNMHPPGHWADIDASNFKRANLVQADLTGVALATTVIEFTNISGALNALIPSFKKNYR